MRYLFLIAFSFILFYGCGDKDETATADIDNKFAVDTSDMKTEPVENPNEPFNMVYKFTAGQPLNYRISTTSNITQVTIADTTITMNVRQSMIYLLNLSAKETDSDGNTELNCTITSAMLELDGSGNNVKYNSDSIKTAADKEKYADTHALVNNPFSLRVNKAGELLEVYKADKIVNAFLEYRNMKDSVNSEDKNKLKMQITESMLNPLLSAVFTKVPGNTVAKDSTWSSKKPVRQMMVFQVEQSSNYRVKDLEKLHNDKLAVIGMETQTNVTGDTKRSEQGVSYNFTRPRIQGTGTLYFNLDKGYVQKIKSETLIETSVTAEANTPQGFMKQSNKETVKTNSLVEKI